MGRVRVCSVWERDGVLGLNPREHIECATSSSLVDFVESYNNMIKDLTSLLSVELSLIVLYEFENALLNKSLWPKAQMISKQVPHSICD